MYLHEDRDFFLALVKSATEQGKLRAGFVEKDYYLYLLLREISRRNPFLVFKGGTALSKCHKVINRFSEDIDFGRDENTITQGHQRKLKYAIVDAVTDCGLEIVNLGSTRSRRDFNRYDIPFSSVFEVSSVEPTIYLETSVSDPSVPYTSMTIGSYLYDYLSQDKYSFTFVETVADKPVSSIPLLERFDLQPFTAKVMSLERTFVDKVFAICNYYLRNAVTRNSRHVYDLHMIFPVIEKNEALAELAHHVRAIRQGQDLSVSAPDSINIAKLLRTLHKKRFYESDYRRNTAPMLFDELPYRTAAATIPAIADWAEEAFG